MIPRFTCNREGLYKLEATRKGLTGVYKQWERAGFKDERIFIGLTGTEVFTGNRERLAGNRKGVYRPRGLYRPTLLKGLMEVPVVICRAVS